MRRRGRLRALSRLELSAGRIEAARGLPAVCGGAAAGGSATGGEREGTLKLSERSHSYRVRGTVTEQEWGAAGVCASLTPEGPQMLLCCQCAQQCMAVRIIDKARGPIGTK
ncbi:hypothetical protein FKM82_027220 [Ascaphus truei]